MPLTPGSNVPDTIRELHSGNTFKRTAAKFGVGDARRQAVAIALSNAGKGRAAGGMVRGYDLGGGVTPQMGIMPPQPPGMMPAGMVPNQFNPGLNAPMGVSPGSPAPMAAPNGMPPSAPMEPAVPPVPTGLSQPPSPMGTTPNNPMARPLMARGGALHRASGGFNMAKGPHLSPPWQQRNEIRGMMTGPVLSAVPGRTDRHAGHVPSGSYVIPADVVSGRGEGNTLAGMQNLQHLFRMGPYGTSPMGMPHGSGAPRPPRPPKPMGMMHSGGGKGKNHNIGVPVRVVVAGGEVIVPPQNLMDVVHHDLSKAHQIMDAWVIHERNKLRKTLAKLPGPAKD